MIRKELRSCRGMIIEKFIAIEQLIAWLISWHYFGKENVDFMLNFFGNDQLNFGFKRNMLFHLFKPKNKDLKDKLNKLNRIRNLFCHSPLMSEQNDRNDNTEFFFRKIDSKQVVNTMLDPREKYMQFNILFLEIFKELNNLAKDNGWPERWFVPQDMKE